MNNEIDLLTWNSLSVSYDSCTGYVAQALQKWPILYWEELSISERIGQTAIYILVILTIPFTAAVDLFFWAAYTVMVIPIINLGWKAHLANLISTVFAAPLTVITLGSTSNLNCSRRGFIREGIPLYSEQEKKAIEGSNKLNELVDIDRKQNRINPDQVSEVVAEHGLESMSFYSKPHEYTAFTKAVNFNCPIIVERMLKLGVDPNHCDGHNLAALDLVSPNLESNGIEVLELLLNNEKTDPRKSTILYKYQLSAWIIEHALYEKDRKCLHAEFCRKLVRAGVRFENDNMDLVSFFNWTERLKSALSSENEGQRVALILFNEKLNDGLTYQRILRTRFLMDGYPGNDNYTKVWYDRLNSRLPRLDNFHQELVITQQAYQMLRKRDGLNDETPKSYTEIETTRFIVLQLDEGVKNQIPYSVLEIINQYFYTGNLKSPIDSPTLSLVQ